MRSEGSCDGLRAPHPLKTNPDSSTVPGGPPGLTAFCRTRVPALDVAPEEGGIHECLVTQVALHRTETVVSAELNHLGRPGVLPISKFPFPWAPGAGSKTKNLI